MSDDPEQKPNGPVIAQDKDGRLYLPRSTLLWVVALVFGGGFLTDGSTNIIGRLIGGDSTSVEISAPQIEKAVLDAVEPIQQSIETLSTIQEQHLGRAMHEGSARELLRQELVDETMQDSLDELTEGQGEVQIQLNLLVRELVDKPASEESEG